MIDKDIVDKIYDMTLNEELTRSKVEQIEHYIELYEQLTNAEAKTSDRR